MAVFFRQRHCGTIQRYGGLREGLRGSLVAWARGVRGVARGGHQPPRPPGWTGLLRTCKTDLGHRSDLGRRAGPNALRGRCGTVPQHPAGGHIQHLSPPRVYSSFFVPRSNSLDRGIARAAVYREHGRLPELSLRRDAVARGGRPGQARAPRALLGGGATASPSSMKTINAAFSQPLRRPRTKLNWSTIVGLLNRYTAVVSTVTVTLTQLVRSPVPGHVVSAGCARGLWVPVHRVLRPKRRLRLCRQRRWLLRRLRPVRPPPRADRPE